jgi:hypothetical protein
LHFVNRSLGGQSALDEFRNLFNIRLGPRIQPGPSLIFMPLAGLFAVRLVVDPMAPRAEGRQILRPVVTMHMVQMADLQQYCDKAFAVAPTEWNRVK